MTKAFGISSCYWKLKFPQFTRGSETEPSSKVIGAVCILNYFDPKLRALDTINWSKEVNNDRNFLCWWWRRRKEKKNRTRKEKWIEFSRGNESRMSHFSGFVLFQQCFLFLDPFCIKWDLILCHYIYLLPRIKFWFFRSPFLHFKLITTSPFATSAASRYF